MEKLDLCHELTADHWQIRDLLTALRNEEMPSVRKHSLVKQLTPWLTLHAKGEEKTLSAFAKSRRSIKVLGFEDDEEHATITQLLQKLSRARNPHQWAARLHLLCEIVEHHLDEEEEEYFPQIKAELSAEESDRLAREYRLATRELDDRRPKPQSGLLGWLSGRPEPADPKSIAL